MSNDVTRRIARTVARWHASFSPLPRMHRQSGAYAIGGPSLLWSSAASRIVGHAANPLGPRYRIGVPALLQIDCTAPSRTCARVSSPLGRPESSANRSFLLRSKIDRDREPRMPRCLINSAPRRVNRSLFSSSDDTVRFARRD